MYGKLFWSTFEDRSTKIEGVRVFVEMDESKFGKRKYGKGEVSRGSMGSVWSGKGYWSLFPGTSGGQKRGYSLHIN